MRITLTDMCMVIYEYERNNEINKKMVEYDGTLNIYSPKKGVSREDIARMYELITIEQDNEQTEPAVEAEPPRDEEIVTAPQKKEYKLLKCTVYVKKILKNGKTDIARFAVKNIENAKRNYISLNDINKEMGYIFGEKSYCIIRHVENEIFSEAIGDVPNFQENESEDEFYYNYFYDVISDVIALEKQLLKERQEREAAALRELEKRINPVYARKVKKLTENMKAVQEQEFSGFDFRDVDIDGMWFIRCSFTACDFTDCRIRDVKFVECSFSNNRMTNISLENCEFFSLLPNVEIL